MSWAERTKMDGRLQFILEHLTGDWPLSALCERHGISRPTGYKWIKRYHEEGPAGLNDRSSAPHVHGRRTADAVAEVLCALKRRHPSWGPRKLVAWLGDHHGETIWPAASTAGEVLKRAGLVEPRKRKRHAPPRLGDLTEPLYPNHVWAADHKGWIPTPYGARLEPLTVTDGFCRYLIVLSATGSTTGAEARPLFMRAFAEYGLPEVIRTDNGSPFASTSVTGLTRLSAEWIRLGIHHERTDPGSPQQNGRHERFHLTLNEAMKAPEASKEAQQQRFDSFRHCYNHERPHEALRQKPPASLYTPSPRPLPRRVPEPVYPAEAAVRKVRSNGVIKWKGELIYIADILIGDAVAVSETEQGEWMVLFYDRPIGVIDPRTNTLKPVKPKPQPEKEQNMTGL